jgi:AcrR family transcriptional regulator
MLVLFSQHAPVVPALSTNERSFYSGAMPRVSAEHLAARRVQILDAARRCFMRNGFHATSMADVLAEAGLSAGAVYRYFPGKNHLILAIAGQTVPQLLERFDTLIGADPVPTPAAAMARVLEIIEPYVDREMRLAVSVWGEALRDPDVGAAVAQVYRAVRGGFVELARRLRDAGHLPADTDPERVGAVLFGMIPGYVLQRLLLGDMDRERYAAGVEQLLRGPQQ